MEKKEEREKERRPVQPLAFTLAFEFMEKYLLQNVLYDNSIP